MMDVIIGLVGNHQVLWESQQFLLSKICCKLRGCQHLYLIFGQKCKMPDVAGDKRVHPGGNSNLGKGQVGWVENFPSRDIQTNRFHMLADCRERNQDILAA